MKKYVWQLDNWRNFPANQQPAYGNIDELHHIESQLMRLPPIVTVGGVNSLLASLKKVANKDAIILHGGDCVETFASINEYSLSQYAKLMTEMSKISRKSLDKDIIVIGRVAGQFAKPRSNITELRNNIALPVYRGDIINSIEFSHEARKPDAKRLLDGYYYSINAIQYLEKLGLNSASGHYISHEALLLNYEQCFVSKHNNEYYNLSSHFLWIGNRTRSPEGAHIEYMRGIHNPIGVKIDCSVTSDELIHLINIINPYNIPGKLTFIFRMGVNNIEDNLPRLIRGIKQQQKSVILMCDPMHGNTIVTSGKKTRNINTILLELGYFIDILKAEKMYFGGIHLEMTNQEIVECVEEGELTRNYNSYCDPRLNFKQSIIVADFIVNKLRA